MSQSGRVTSVVGHIFSMDFPSAYQNWDATNPADLFDAEVVSTPESKGGIIKHLEREASGMDYLVLWLDCDREGENICFEVIPISFPPPSLPSRR
jgi:DNA topoisomerase III